MLWFRSESDFNDWLNNPYHNQAQRNFLIKLAVNFVHDLYKPNVRGYQVTQCRTKGYGNKSVRQFKLERWMDYGPTIAAAFGSYDPKEVDACRAAIVECMKNTPLDNGIRATGAVKEHHEQMKQIEAETHQLEERLKQSQQARENELTGGGDGNRNAGQNNSATGGDRPVPTSSQSLVETTDLLGDMAAFDDSASVPPGALVPAAPPAAYPGAPPAPAPYYQQPPQQQQPPPPQQPQYPAYGQPPAQQQGYYQQQQQAPPDFSQPAAGAAPQFNQPPPQQQTDMGQGYGYGYGSQQQPPPPAGYPTAAYPTPSNF